MLPSKMHVVVTLRIRRRNFRVLFSASICATDGRIIVARDPVSALGTGYTEVPFRSVHRRYEEIHSDPDRNIVDSMEWRMPPDIAAV